MARAAAFDHQILRPSKSVDEEAVMATRVHEHDLEVKNLRWRVRDFPKLSAARGLISVDRISGFSSGDA